MTRGWLLLFLLVGLPDWAEAVMTCPASVEAPNVCWYVRPDDDGINDLNYGAEDGTTEATAFDGFVGIVQANLSPGDVVCLPGTDEPFLAEQLPNLGVTMTSGTVDEPITYQGCAATRPRIWGVKDLTGDRSYDTSSNLITGNPAYDWFPLDNNIWRKRIDIKPSIFWEDETWLTPVNVWSKTEAQILALLQPGEFGTRDDSGAGGVNTTSTGPYATYYRPTTAEKNPTNTTIRSDRLGPSGSSERMGINVSGSHLVFRGIDIWGHALRATSTYGVFISNVTDILIDDVTMFRNATCGLVQSNQSAGGVGTDDIRFLNSRCLYPSRVGIAVNPLSRGIHRLTFEGGEYSHVLGRHYDGIRVHADDGDAIGLGFTATAAWVNGTVYALGYKVNRSARNYQSLQAHTANTANDAPGTGTNWTAYWVLLNTTTDATLQDVVIKNLDASHNRNRGVFSGTSEGGYYLYNLSIIGVRAEGNGRGCFSEGNDAEVTGTLLISGLVCTGNLGIKQDLNDPNEDGILIEDACWDCPGSSNFSAIRFSNNLLIEPRTIILTHSTFANNINFARVEFYPHIHNNYAITNNVFYVNPGVASDDQGDFTTQNLDVIGDEVIQNNYFYSLPNTTRRMARLNTPAEYFLYDAANLTAFSAAFSGGGVINNVLNVDPLLISSSDVHLQAGSPLINAGIQSANCYDALAVSCAADASPDIGAYQAIAAPEAPTGLHFVGQASNTRVQLVWNPNTEADLAGYKVYVGHATGQTILVATIPLATHHPATQWFGAIASACDPCYFAVTAYNETGGTTNVSLKSAEVSRAFTASVSRPSRMGTP